jgi:hypothetical protein
MPLAKNSTEIKQPFLEKQIFFQFFSLAALQFEASAVSLSHSYFQIRFKM